MPLVRFSMALCWTAATGSSSISLSWTSQGRKLTMASWLLINNSTEVWAVSHSQLPVYVRNLTDYRTSEAGFGGREKRCLMSVTNTDWEEYISSSRSPFAWDPEVYFALYIHSAVFNDDADGALSLAEVLMQDGFEKRKTGLGHSIWLVRDVKPHDVWEATRYHKCVAKELGCNTQFGCFIKLENWSVKRYVRVFRVEESFDSFSMSVGMAGETLHFVAIEMKT